MIDIDSEENLSGEKAHTQRVQKVLIPVEQLLIFYSADWFIRQSYKRFLTLYLGA